MDGVQTPPASRPALQGPPLQKPGGRARAARTSGSQPARQVHQPHLPEGERGQDQRVLPQSLPLQRLSFTTFGQERGPAFASQRSAPFTPPVIAVGGPASGPRAPSSRSGPGGGDTDGSGRGTAKGASASSPPETALESPFGSGHRPAHGVRRRLRPFTLRPRHRAAAPTFFQEPFVPSSLARSSSTLVWITVAAGHFLGIARRLINLPAGGPCPDRRTRVAGSASSASPS